MLNKLVLRVFLSLTLVFTLLGTANATLISQDILLDSAFDAVDEFQVVGQVTINVDTLDDFNSVSTWESFSFYGFEMDPLDPNFDFFSAVVDPTNLFAGIESLDFEATLFDGFYIFAGYIDTYVPDDSITFSFWDVNNDLLEAGNLAFGEATVVPEPSALILLLTGLVAFAARRKVSK